MFMTLLAEFVLFAIGCRKTEGKKRERKKDTRAFPQSSPVPACRLVASAAGPGRTARAAPGSWRAGLAGGSLHQEADCVWCQSVAIRGRGRREAPPLPPSPVPHPPVPLPPSLPPPPSPGPVVRPWPTLYKAAHLKLIAPKKRPHANEPWGLAWEKKRGSGRGG